jgi:hypothetical protein
VAAALTEGSLAWVRDAVASWCRRVDAVQDARRRRRRRTGAGAVKLRWWRRPSPPRATPGGVSLLGLSSSSSFSLSLSLRCGSGGVEQGLGWLGFRSAAGVLMRGAGLLGVRAGTRGGIVARGERG